DGDGDQDVLSASFEDDRIAWYGNTDGLGSFGFQQTITTAADGASSVFAADLDGDGDQDVLSASSYFADDKVAWYENGGGPAGVIGTFGP
ncbi:VCBS repeat-containing protein, partial [Shewanella sp. A25]|nr:VCBS repeat-containing protein [Shewanella shenzhenensis]